MISIIVPVYNVVKYVRRCLDSISKQTFKDYECIVIDDGSTDGSGQICDEFAAADPRFHVIHQSNKGISAARNIGLDNAKGNFIAFVDSDDYLHPKCYEHLYRTAQETKSPITLIKARDVSEDENRVLDDIMGNPSTYSVKQDQLIYFAFDHKASPNLYAGFAWNKLYQKVFIGSERFIDPPSEDLDFNLRFFRTLKQVAVVEAIGYYYRKRRDSIVNRDLIKFSSKNTQFYFHLYFQYLNKFSRSLRAKVLWVVCTRLRLLSYLAYHTAYETEVKVFSRRLYKQNKGEIKALVPWHKRMVVELSLYCQPVYKVLVDTHIFLAKFKQRI